MSYRKILDKNKNVVDGTPEQVEEFHSDINNSRVGRDIINGKLISTVFLGSDHGIHRAEIWFETMVFDAESGKINYGNDLESERYYSYEEAVEGHKRLCEKYRNMESK